MSEQELIDLQHLVKHPGWQRFVAQTKAEWEEQLSRHLELAANDRDDTMAANKIRQVIAARNAITRALAWPSERIKTLEHQAIPVAPSMSRGGL
jgi:hypothetical protein